ncbi:hypothetical protein [Aquimonas sp.]|jgi:hypothetical protein|uniref:hypothetical protein n=1 Tax=Aquimonas sp. TaxID=1872588 RepID=UPI0037BE72F1
MRGAVSAFNASVVDLFSCALLAMLVIWVTAMGSGAGTAPLSTDSVFVSIGQYDGEGHFTEATVTYLGLPCKMDQPQSECGRTDWEGPAGQSLVVRRDVTLTPAGRLLTAVGTGITRGFSIETDHTHCSFPEHFISLGVATANGHVIAIDDFRTSGIGAFKMRMTYIPGGSVVLERCDEYGANCKAFTHGTP